MFRSSIFLLFTLSAVGAEINGSLTIAQITTPSAPATSLSTLYVNITTGVIGCLNAASTNCFNVNMSAAAPPTLPATTTFYVIGAAGGSSRELNIAYAGTAFSTGARYDGTPASPTAVQAADQLSGYNAIGYDGSVISGPVASFRIFANQTFTSIAHGSYADITTTANGSTTAVEAIRFENDAGITVPSTVTGGDKGAGTINAGGLFVNGVAVGTGSGTVTSIATNNGITGGTITTTGTIGLASVVANTVLGALTATTPTGLALPSCSTTSSALTWTSGTGFGCNTAYLATLTIGTTPISGSTTNAILYSDGTLLQNAAGVTRTAAGQLTYTQNALGTTPSDAVILKNTTAAASGAQQVSPQSHWQGQGWKTNATAASENVDAYAYVKPIQGTTNPTGYLVFATGSGGTLNTGGDVSVYIPAASGITYLGLNCANATGTTAAAAFTTGSYGGTSGIVEVSFCPDRSTNFTYMGAYGYVAENVGFYGFSSSTALTSIDTNVFRVSAGVVGVGKSSTVANGLLNLAGATFLDPTATTGATRVIVSLGAADSTTTNTLTNAGTVSTVGLIVSGQPATTGQRYACLTTTGQIVSSATACVGT